MLINLPPEILGKIFLLTSLQTRTKIISRVCKFLNYFIFNHDILWSRLNLNLVKNISDYIISSIFYDNLPFDTRIYIRELYLNEVPITLESVCIVLETCENLKIIHLRTAEEVLEMSSVKQLLEDLFFIEDEGEEKKSEQIEQNDDENNEQQQQSEILEITATNIANINNIDNIDNINNIDNIDIDNINEENGNTNNDEINNTDNDDKVTKIVPRVHRANLICKLQTIYWYLDHDKWTWWTRNDKINLENTLRRITKNPRASVQVPWCDFCNKQPASFQIRWGDGDDVNNNNNIANINGNENVAVAAAFNIVPTLLAPPPSLQQRMSRVYNGNIREDGNRDGVVVGVIQTPPDGVQDGGIVAAVAEEATTINENENDDDENIIVQTDEDGYVVIMELRNQLIDKEKNDSIIIIEDGLKNNNPNNLNNPNSLRNSDNLNNSNNSINDSNNPKLWNFKKKFWILFIISLLNMIAPFCNAIIYPALSDIRSDFNTSEIIVSSTGISPLFWASYSDLRKTRRKVYLASIILFVISSIIGAVSTNIWLLSAMRALQASSSSPGQVIGAGVIKRGRKYGLFYVGFFTGNLVGPIIGGYFALISWRWVFWFLAIFETVSSEKRKVNVCPEMRIKSVWISAILVPLSFITYGWLIERKVYMVFPIIFIFLALLGISSTETYLVDAYPTKSASAVSVNKFICFITSGIISNFAVSIQDALVNMNDVIDISDIPIYIVGNDDIQLLTLIVVNLYEKGARNISVLISNTHEKNINKESINANIIPGTWKDIKDFEAVLSALFAACLVNKVVIFITWDSGMELDHLNFNSHEYYNSSSIHNNWKSPNEMKWILFQVGLFAENILNNDISTITTAFNSPSQYIFVNVSVKSDFAKIIAETIINKKVLPDRNYVVGEFVSHTFLGHVYKVFNDGLEFDDMMNYKITDYETTNQLRINGIISPQPMPRILYPSCDSYMQKLCIEISFQFEAVIYKILENSHRQETLKDWETCNKEVTEIHFSSHIKNAGYKNLGS
ncbi:8142_t:CDS:10 [Diversispora eburnea]|uniref:8142_t:CDS:1 n=1 Tax=Diversispora eburnea TaxID=1213867 RepID=A0A9N9F164_9GLOM|nr:8142_t:CDS:10 [Diversispora eburnea]